MPVEHQEFLEEILQTLTEDAQEDNAPEVTMKAVVAIVDDYKSELAQEEAEQEERDKLAMMGINPEVEEDADDDFSEEERPVSITKPINRAFLLTKAQKDYYKKLGLTEEDAAAFSPSEKMKHRKGVTALFNKMVLAEQAKPVSPSQYSNGPFKKIAGITSVARKVTDDEDDEVFDTDAVTPAELKWKRQQTKELKGNIKSLSVEIEELKRQNGIKKISPSIINRNNERIAELEEELEEIETQKNQYT